MTEQEEFEFRARMEAEQATNKNADTKAEPWNKGYASAAGLVGNPVAAKLIGSGIENVRANRAPAPVAEPVRPGPTVEAANALAQSKGPDAVENWAKTQHGGQFFGGQNYSEAHQKAMNVRGGEKQFPRYKAVTGSGVFLPEEDASSVNQARAQAQAAIENEKRLALEAQARAQGKARALGTANRFVEGVGKGVSPWIRHGVAGGAAGYNIADTQNRILAGDVPGAAISGTGAVANAALGLPRIPGKLGVAQKIFGVLGSLASPYINYTRDKEKEENPEGYAGGSKVIKGGLSLLKGSKKAAHEAADEVKKLSDVAQEHIGRFYVPTQADRMGGVGGPSYSANQLLYPEYSGMAWGSGQPATASGLANLAKDPRFGGPEGQLFAPLLGAENMHQSNQMVFDELLNQFYKNQKSLTPELRRAINDYMQTGGTITGKKAGFEGYPGFDIADKKMMQDLGQTFEARKQIAQHAFGGQGIGGRKAQIIPYEEILRKTRDPLTEGAETFSMGPRAFKLTGETHPVPRPDLNPAYPFQLYGSDIGAAYTPVPSELSLMDFQRGWRQNTGKTMPLKSGKLPQPGYYEHTLGYTPAGSSERIYPRQQITEDWIKELQRSGFAEGGLAHLAGGGVAQKMFQQLYRGYAGKPGAEEIFASPQKRVAEYYAQKRAAQTGLQPGVEAVQVDPFAGKQYGHALPIDQFNQDVVTTQARKLSPLDVLTPKPNRMTEFELSMAEQIDQMRQAKKAQDARLAEYYRQKAEQHTVEPRPAQDLGRSVAELAESMEARYK